MRGRYCSTAVQSFLSTRLDYCNSLMYGIADGPTASSGPERRRTSDHRRSTTRLHTACSPAAALDSNPPTSSVEAGPATVQSAAVLDGRLSTRCRCRSPSTKVIWLRHMFIATDQHLPRRSCVWCWRTTSVEHFTDQPPSASALVLTYLTNFEPMQQQWLEHRHMFRKLRLTMSMNSSWGSRGTTTLDECLIWPFETEITSSISLARVTPWYVHVQSHCLVGKA